MEKKELLYRKEFFCSNVDVPNTEKDKTILWASESDRIREVNKRIVYGPSLSDTCVAFVPTDDTHLSFHSVEAAPLFIQWIHATHTDVKEADKVQCTVCDRMSQARS